MAVDLAVDVEMAIVGLADADFALAGRDDIVAAHFCISTLAEREEIVLEGEGDEGGGEDEQPGERHLEALAERQPAYHQATADQHQTAKKIKEIKGLVTAAPDDLDWEDEIRLAVEERTSLSPDALTGMEASLRFPGEESLETKIFGRLSAWQNWVFIRPNSTGEHGALKLFGTGSKARFTWERV